MSEQIREELELIKESILQVVPAEAIYLFGSYAYGTPREDSDLDIYVVVPDDAGDMSEIYGEMLMQMNRKKAVNIDLLVGTSSVFNRRKHGPTLQRVVARKGMVLHGASDYS